MSDEYFKTTVNEIQDSSGGLAIKMERELSLLLSIAFRSS